MEVGSIDSFWQNFDYSFHTAWYWRLVLGLQLFSRSAKVADGRLRPVADRILAIQSASGPPRCPPGSWSPCWSGASETWGSGEACRTGVPSGLASTERRTNKVLLAAFRPWSPWACWPPSGQALPKVEVPRLTESVRCQGLTVPPLESHVLG